MNNRDRIIERYMIIARKAPIIANKPREEIPTNILQIKGVYEIYLGSFNKHKIIHKTVKMT